MIRWVVGSSLKFRRVVVVVALGLIVVGLFQARGVKVDALPEFNPTIVEVQTEALGLSAREVEQLITVPLEQDLLNGVAFLDEIESISMPGLSSIVMTFEPGTPLLDARQVVEERLTQAHALPQVSKPPQMLQPLSSTSRAQMVRLSSQQLTEIETSVLARWVIVPRLLGVDGVANVAIWGQRERQLQVQVDPNRLTANGVTLQQVIHTTGNALEFSPLSYLEASTPGTGGFIETVNQRFQIFHEQAINTPAELAQVPIQDTEGRPVRGPDEQPLALGSVTKVVEDHQPLIGDALCKDGPCVLLIIEKFPGANTVDVTNGVEDAFEVLKPGLADMDIDPTVYRPATAVESSFGALGWRLMIALGLLLVVLVLFFRNWRTTLVSVVAIAASLAGAVLVLAWTGTTLNLIVLLGLIAALGAVVDDALGDGHNLARRIRALRADAPDVPIWRVALDASLEMRKAVFCAVLVVAAATVPVFALEAEAGTLLPEIVKGYLLAIGVSMLVALTVTPALSAMLLSRGSPEIPEPAAGRWAGSLYERSARRTLPLGSFAFVGVAVFLLIGAVLVPRLDTMMRPALEKDLLVDVDAAAGTSLPRMREIVSQALTDLGAIPGVRNVGAHVGRAVLSDEKVNVNSGEIWLNLADNATPATVERVESTLRGYDGIDVAVRTYWDKRLAEVLHLPSDDLVVRVYGENPEVRKAKAEQIKEVLGRIKGVSRAEVDQPVEEPTVQVEVDLNRARNENLKPGDVRREVTTLLSGITVGNLFEEQKVFDVVVWGTPDLRKSVDDVANLRIHNPDGRTVRLGDIANVRTVQSPTVVRHESVFGYLDVTAGVAGRDLGSVADDVEVAIQAVDFPLEHHAELLDRYDDELAARQKFLAFAVLGALAVFLLFQAAFASWRLAVLTFFTLPVAIVGGLLALRLFDLGFTLGSVAGLLAIYGLTARHGIVLVQRYQFLERNLGQPFGMELVTQGTRERLGPIVGTLAATAVVQVPFLFATNAPGVGLVRPMAIAVVGGLVTSLLLTLVLLPALYLKYGFVAAPDRAGEELFPSEPELTQPAIVTGPAR